MKLLYIGHPHATPEKEDWYQALKKVYDCTFYTKELTRYQIDFDIIYVHAGSISYRTLFCLKYWNDQPGGVSSKGKIVVWTGDVREDLMSDVTMYNGIADIVLLACGMGKQKEMYEKEMGCPVHWFPHGVAEWNFRPVNENSEGLIFIGNNYEHFSGARDRYEINKQLKAKYGDKFKIYGNGWGDIGEGVTVPFEDTPDYYNKAYIGIDGSIFNDKDGYFSNRPLDVMAGGSVCLVRSFPAVRKCFELDWTWDDFDSLVRLMNKFKNNEYRNFIAKQQQQFVRDNFHYDVLAQKFLNIING